VKKGAGLEQVPSEFFTLAQWMHQSTLFNVLTSMDFFKYYLIGKVFRLWKGNVRYKTYNRTRQQLSKALIQTRPAFLNSFMDINKTLYEMKSKLTFQIPTNGKGYDIGEFCNDQKTQRDEIKSHYDTCITKIISEILSNLVKSVTDSRNLKEDEDFEGGSMG
jgi:dynein heavy chain